MNDRYQLLIRAEGGVGPARQKLCDGDERLDVRDLTTRATVQVRARDVSPYRHTLFLDGRAYQILNVLRPA